MQDVFVDAPLDCNKTSLSSDIDFTQYWNNFGSTMYESHKQPCSSPELAHNTCAHIDPPKKQTVGTSSQEPATKSIFSSTDKISFNRPNLKNVDGSISVSPRASLDAISKNSEILASAVSLTSMLPGVLPNSNVSTQSADTPISPNLEEYFPAFGCSDTSEADLPISRTFNSSPMSNGSQEDPVDSKSPCINKNEKKLIDNTRESVIDIGKNKIQHPFAIIRGSPGKPFSEKVQQEADETDGEKCMKFAEVLYKCTLCTTLPSILTSKQSFFSHVRREHLNDRMSHFSCKQCTLNFCTAEDLTSHQTACHLQVVKGTLSESSDDCDSNDVDSVQEYRQSSNVMWCSEKEHKPNPIKSNSYQNISEQFQNPPDSTLPVGVTTVISGSPKGKKPLELKRGIAHCGNPSNYKQTIYLPYCREQNSPIVNSFPQTGIAELEKLTNQMMHSQNLNLGPMSRMGSNLNSFTPEFGRYTKLVREGGNIVYFCQVCNWKCPVKTIFQTHCRGILHQTKVQSADDSSGNSSNSPGPTTVTDVKRDNEILKQRHTPVNLCLNEVANVHVDRAMTGDPKPDKMPSTLGNKSPLRSLLSPHRSPSAVCMNRNTFLDKTVTGVPVPYCTTANDIRIPCGTQNEGHTVMSATSAPKGKFVVVNGIKHSVDNEYFQRRNYEYSHRNVSFCNSPNNEYPSKLTRGLHRSENNKASSCRNRRKRPAPVALRNQFSDSDTDSDSNMQQKRENEETRFALNIKAKQTSPLVDATVGYRPNKFKRTSQPDISCGTPKTETFITESTNRQSSYYCENRRPPQLASAMHCMQTSNSFSNYNPIGDDHKRTAKSSSSTMAQIKKEPFEDEFLNITYSCTNCGFTTVLFHVYRDHMTREHCIDVMNTRRGDSAMPDKTDYVIGEHDDFTSERTNINSEGWKIVKIKGALPGNADLNSEQCEISK